METLGTGLALVGIAGMALAQLWVIAAAFKNSVVWGLLVLFIPFVSLLYIVIHFSDMKFPVGMYVIGLVILLAGAGLSGRGQHQRQLRAQREAAAAAGE